MERIGEREARELNEVGMNDGWTGPDPIEIMRMVWELERWRGRCCTTYSVWRDDLPGAEWARRLSAGQPVERRDEEEFPCLPR